MICLFTYRVDWPVMGGGSTTVEGPKKEGPSPEVVTGVLRSPGGTASMRSVTGPAAGEGLPPAGLEGPRGYRQVSKLSTLKWWAAAAADSVSRKLWWGARVSNPSMIIVADWSGGLGAPEDTREGAIVCTETTRTADWLLSAPRHVPLFYEWSVCPIFGSGGAANGSARRPPSPWTPRYVILTSQWRCIDPLLVIAVCITCWANFVKWYTKM